MGTNRKDLKAFIRYDGGGRAIPGSLILARKAPKMGNWVEIDAYECCNPTTTTIPCICDYCGVLTVGISETGYYGYMSGEGGYGSISPVNNDIPVFAWVPNMPEDGLYIYHTNCYEALSIIIDGTEYEVPNIGGETYSIYFIATENPFTVVGSEHNIQICYGDPCVTTTTTTFSPPK